jgi:hypothetical protein
VRQIFLKIRASLQTNISHCGIIKPWEQNDLIGKLFMTESLGVFSQNNGWDKIIHRTDRCDLSLFQLGKLLLHFFLRNEQPLPQFSLIL